MNTYCAVYVDTRMSFNKIQLVNLVAQWTDGTIDPSSFRQNTISTPWGEIDVEDNMFFDEKKCRELPDGFLYFRYCFEAEKAEGVCRDVYVTAIANLLDKLWSVGYRAVAACDFENELPRNGGFFNGALVE